MKQSGLIKRQQAEIQAYIDAAQDTMCQMMADCICLAANEQLGLGKQRLTSLLLRCREILNLYWTACGNAAESDYYREKLDRALGQIFGDDLQPFEERYPSLKQIRTGKKK